MANTSIMANTSSRLSLRWQICILVGIILALSIGPMSWLTFRESSRLATKPTQDVVMSETIDAADMHEQELQIARADALQTPRFPPIPDLIRCWDNDGMDDVQIGSTT